MPPLAPRSLMDFGVDRFLGKSVVFEAFVLKCSAYVLIPRILDSGRTSCLVLSKVPFQYFPPPSDHSKHIFLFVSKATPCHYTPIL